MKKAQKIIENQVNQMFNKLGDCIQFNIMDLGKIDKAAKNILLAGGSLEEAEMAMAEAIQKYRIN